MHLKYYHDKEATIIQKCYKGYRVRKMINDIYKRLPDDIQRKIIYFIREDYYYNNYKKVLKDTIESKIENFNKISNAWSITDGDNFYIHISENINYLMYIYNLYEKYYTLLSFDISNIMYKHFEQILRIYYLTDDYVSGDPNISKNIRKAYYTLGTIIKEIDYSDC